MVQYSYDRYGRPIKWNVEWQNFDDDHREDLFHSTVGIQESTGILRTCNLIIDHEATINLVSAEVVDNFKLPVITHPYPYSFGWFKDGSKVKVTKQVLIHLTLGNFTDQVLCDIVPMKVHHLLLGMPWLDEKCVMYDGSSTRYYIDINGKRTRFTSMTQQRVFQTHKAQEVRDAHRENALRDEIEKQTTIEENVPQLLIPKSVCDAFSLENEEKGVAINSDEVHDPVISTPKELVAIPDLQADIALNFEEIHVGIKDVEVFVDIPDTHDTDIFEATNGAPILPRVDSDFVERVRILKHEFVDPYLVHVDISPDLHFSNYLVSAHGVILNYIQPRGCFGILLVRHGAHNPNAHKFKMFVRILFDPGIILGFLLKFHGVKIADADFYDIMLIRGRIIFQPGGNDTIL